MEFISGEEEDYEYEYDETATETFLVDLDLSSLNGTIRSRNQGIRNTLKSIKRDAQRSATDLERRQPQDTVAEPDEEIDSVMQDATENNYSGLDPIQKQSKVQILDFHSHNPIISYQDQIYSCTWTDMIGTAMFFNRPQEEHVHEPLRATDDYELTGTSRIKLVGHQAKVRTKTSKKREHGDGDADRTKTSMPQDQVAQGNGAKPRLLAVDPRVQAQVQRQADFLDKLTTLKRARYNSDNSNQHPADSGTFPETDFEQPPQTEA